MDNTSQEQYIEMFSIYLATLNMDNFQKILNFTKTINDFRKIERAILLPEKRFENDSEHSFQLTIVSWYMAEIEDLNLDKNKIIKYALIHDLVELHAGDTPLYSLDEGLIKSKKERERKAVLIIKEQFPEFPELHGLIQQYKERNDEESKFVFAVDKLLPVMSIYLDNGHDWKNSGVNINMIISKNTQTISVAPEVKKYFDAIIILLKEKPEYFINYNINNYETIQKSN